MIMLKNNGKIFLKFNFYNIIYLSDLKEVNSYEELYR